MQVISADLTTGNHEGDVPFGTTTTISESPLRFGLLYVGTDDGNIHVSKDDGYTDSPEALLKTLPNEYEHFVNEPAFSLDTISRIGYLNNGEWIYLGIDVKYLPLVERIYSMSKDDYFKWAYEYFEISVDTLLADAIWADPASLPTAKLINTDLDIDAFKLDLIEIGLTSRCTGADNG